MANLYVLYNLTQIDVFFKLFLLYRLDLPVNLCSIMCLSLYTTINVVCIYVWYVVSYVYVRYVVSYVYVYLHALNTQMGVLCRLDFKGWIAMLEN